jgi:SAM-dependent methyltransferase
VNQRTEPGATSVNPQIDTKVDPAALAALLMHVETCWRRLGETEPHWSVLSAPQFKSDRIGDTGPDFYASGEGDVVRWQAAADRCGVALPLRGTCFELGCGLARITLWLAKSFHHVIGADISPSHLALAGQAVRQAGRDNIDLRLVNRLDTLERLPAFDSFFSMIVLQHNPPPVMRWLLLTLLSKLKSGGIGYFQVPTAIPNYSFNAAAYLAQLPTHGEMEMHVLPHEVVLATVHEAGCELLEAHERNIIGYVDSMSVEYLVRKVGRVRWFLRQSTKQVASYWRPTKATRAAI